DLIACRERPGLVILPVLNPEVYCIEEILTDGEHGELAFTALTIAPDGTLYAARPLYGQVLRLRDGDNDYLLDTPDIIADNLTLPNALVFHEGALYIAGGNHIYRWQPDGETLTVLVDDIPAGAGFWTGGLAIMNERLYVGTGAPCDTCVWDDPERGAILSFALDGSDRQVIAQGFRQPAGITPDIDGEHLWVTDSARDGLEQTNWLDELNRVSVTSENQHGGFPYCVGAENTPDIAPGDFDCTQALKPVIAFETHSMPLAPVLYQGDGFAFTEGKMLMLLSGSLNRPDVHGYQVIAITLPDAQDGQILIETLAPYEGRFLASVNSPLYQLPGYRDGSAELLNQSELGWYPHRLYGLAVSPEGWIYISQGGGRILILRA
ncbi:MAG: PQQ-dependent sugar dehydrogenase, partial [Aggregatilineales bacterium]